MSDPTPQEVKIFYCIIWEFRNLLEKKGIAHGCVRRPVIVIVMVKKEERRWRDEDSKYNCL